MGKQWKCLLTLAPRELKHMSKSSLPGSKTQSCFLVGLPVEPKLYSFLAVTQARLERQLWPTQEWIYQKCMGLRVVLVRIHLRGEERQSSLAL